MLTRKQIATFLPNRSTHAFAGVRWVALAHRLANRYRVGRLRLHLTLQWRRRLTHARRLWEQRWISPASSTWQVNVGRWISPASSAWQVNVGLDLHFLEEVNGTRKLSSGVQLASPPLSYDRTPRSAERNATNTWVTNNFDMKRFVTPYVPLALQPMRVLTGRLVHTSVRPIVREKLRVEHRMLSVPMANKAHRHQPDSVEPKTIVTHNMHVPATTAPTGALDINIAQLADQVMRQLDHRISAWRERRGRA